MSRLWCVWILLVYSCNAPSFFSGPSSTPPPRVIPSQPYVDTISCEVEALRALPDPKKSLRALQWSLEFQKTCPGSVMQQVLRDVTRPLYVMFVIDVTHSMQPSVQVIQDNLIALSENLIARGYTPRFAAVTFTEKEREKGSGVYQQQIEVSDFYAVWDLLNQVQKGKIWQVHDGGDYQEPGMKAIQVALESLRGLALKEPQSRYGDLVLFYVSNGMMYKENDHLDFSTKDLSKELSQFRQEQVSFRVLYSVDEKPEGAVDHDKNPHEQFQDMLGYAVVPSVDLGFPLDNQSFDAFTREYKETQVELEAQCVMQDVYSKQGEKKQSHAVENKEDQLITQMPATSSLCVERCCRYTATDVCHIVTSCFDIK